MPDDKGISIVVINGTVRPGNYTSKASALVVDELRKYPKLTVEVINPAELNLPFPGVNPHAEGTRKLQEAVKNATAVVLVTPEYHGSLSSVTKLVIEISGPPRAGRQAGGVVGVAAGSIGAVKALESCGALSLHWGHCSAVSGIGS